MALVLHRVTKELRRSVNTPDYNPIDWIINPDLSAVAGQPVKYWLISGDIVSVADAAQQATIDAALLAAAEARQKEEEKEQFDTDRRLKAFAELLVNELNSRGDTVNQLLSAIRLANNLANLQMQVNAINDIPARTFQQLRTAIRNNIDAGAN